MAWVAPLIAAGGSVASAGLQSRGAKKAAKGSEPQIPKQFMPALSAGLGVVNRNLRYGATPFLGPTLAGQDGVLGAAGGAGLRSAFDTIQQFSQSGISPEHLALIKQTTDPFYDDLRKDLVAGTREATGSRFFGSGSAQQEMDTLRRFEGDRAAQAFPLALAAGQQQLGAAGTLYDLLQSEFLRTQPEAAIPGLAALMGSSQFYNPAVAPGFGSALGANIGSLIQSPGFWNWLNQARGAGATSQGGQVGPASSSDWRGWA